MKITKRCPECGGTEIYMRDSSLDGHTRALLPGVSGILGGPKIEVYVCGQCGFHQMFVNEEYLEKIKDNYELYD